MVRSCLGPLLPSGQAWITASSVTVAGMTSSRLWDMLWAIALRAPLSFSIGPTSVRILCTRCTSAAVIMPSGPLGVMMVRSTLSRCASARTAGVTLRPAAVPTVVAFSATTSLLLFIAPTTVPVSVIAPVRAPP